MPRQSPSCAAAQAPSSTPRWSTRSSPLRRLNSRRCRADNAGRVAARPR